MLRVRYHWVVAVVGPPILLYLLVRSVPVDFNGVD